MIEGDSTDTFVYTVGQGAVRAVSFDYSGTYLGIGGGGAHGQAIHVKVVKDWSNSVVSRDLVIENVC